MTGPRAILLVLDGVGVGELPDAGEYGDRGSDTLGNLSREVGGLSLPNLTSMGLGNLHRIEGVPPVEWPLASYGRMAERSRGKDSTTGHWELMGLVRSEPFPTYPEGFPRDIIESFERRTGRKVICNRPASGTEIIEKLGEEQRRTEALIVYTSADSVFQIAAHEDIVPPDDLYRYCSIARDILAPPEHGVARVIARPFQGRPGNYRRTARRRDFSLPPTGRTLLDALEEAGIPRTGVGKVDDLFAHRNIETVHVANNAEGLGALEGQMADVASGMIFANLCDFDSRYGHRNDPRGFAEALEEADAHFPTMLSLLSECDIFVVTADHGNDPTTESTDHSREYVPLLMYQSRGPVADLRTRRTFSDVACTFAGHLGLRERFPGDPLIGGEV
ncbi:phosphopentomutase [Candidatus Fermentibacteria bacterium]|nr:phosphopentomutase [Candidatus Fermentibacteria bacterium]